MKMKITSRLSCTIFTLLCYQLTFGIDQATGKSPDIVMIAIDDLRPMLGCYGDRKIKSPNIDSLAKRGVVFERAYCQYAKCGTSRLSLMTGLRPDSIGIFSNKAADAAKFRANHPEIDSIARWLKKSGYHTQSFGKIYHDGWDNRNDWSTDSLPGRDHEMLEITDTENIKAPTIIAERLNCPVLQAPDVPDEHLFAGRMTSKVIDTLDHFENSKPLFLAVGFRRPHLPFVAPKTYFDRYQIDDSWLASNQRPNTTIPIMSWFNSDGYIGSARKVGLTMPLQPDYDQARDWNGYEMRSYQGVPNQGPIPHATQVNLIHAYAACISYVDAQIGRILEHLRHSPRFKNAIIVLWSDHGWHLGEHSAWGKMTNFEIATRVPLIISAPDFKPSRTDYIAELVDLYPTLCDLAEVQKPKHLEGNSLLKALQSEDSSPQSAAPSMALSQYTRFRDRYMGRAIRTPNYRYIAWFDQRENSIVGRELYDHRVDSDENDNLASMKEHAATVANFDKQVQRLFGLPVIVP
nr:sulfatase [Rubripirellula sp.]